MKRKTFTPMLVYAKVSYHINNIICNKILRLLRIFNYILFTYINEFQYLQEGKGMKIKKILLFT